MNILKLLQGQRCPLVRLYLNTLLKPQLEDLRCLLQLPKGSLRAGCNLTAGISLLNVIAGISVCLYKADIKRFKDEKNSGLCFQSLFFEYYPWQHEPVEKEEAAKVLWKNARNPIAHSLGLYSPAKAEDSVSFDKSALSIARVKEIEASDSRPNWLPPTMQRGMSYYCYEVSIPSMYWGVCQLLKKLLSDRRQTRQSERFFGHLHAAYDMKNVDDMLLKLKQLPSHSVDYRNKEENIGLVLTKLKAIDKLHPTQKERFNMLWQRYQRIRGSENKS